MRTKLERLEDWILPLVTKPGRYLPPASGWEPGNEGARIGILVPRSYEDALSWAPFLLLVQALEAAADRASPPGIVDFAFSPEPDLEQELERHELSHFVLRSRRPLSELDALILLPSRVFEVPEALALLERGAIPSRRGDRTPRHPLIVLAGPLGEAAGPVTDGVDLVLSGDPEAFADDLFEVLGEGGSSRPPRDELCARLEGRPGVRAPGDAGTLTRRQLESPPLRWGSPLVPLAEVALPGLPVQLGRSRRSSSPGRADETVFRPADEVITEVETLVAETGCAEVRLAGEEASRHPDLGFILEVLNQRLRPREVHLRLEEVDPGVFTVPIARELRKNRTQSLHFTPIAPSEKLRQALGRPLSNEALLEAARIAVAGGWGHLRFRVLAGLPGETAEDRGEWERTLSRVAGARPRRGQATRLQLEIVPFVPRPGEAVDAPAPSPSSLEAITEAWRTALKRHRIKVMSRDLEQASLEAALLGGGEKAATALATVFRRGGRRQDRQEFFDFELWNAALEEAGLSLGHPGVSAPIPETVRVPARVSASPGGGFGLPAWSGGRRPRRSGRGRDVRASERFRLRYSKDEAMRFFSHLDVTRAFERACRRSQLPVAMSQGKDRRPRFSFGPPLPLGMTGGAEVFDITFSQEVPEGFVRSLGEMLPEGLTVVAAAPIRTEGDSLSSAVQLAEYEVTFPDSLIHAMQEISFDELKSRLEECAERAMAADTILVTRMKGKKPQTFNARPSLIRTGVVRDDGGRPVLDLRLTLGRPDSVRPEILTAALLNWTSIEERLLRVHRSGLYIPGRGKDLDPLEVVGSGFAWWRQPVRGGTVL